MKVTSTFTAICVYEKELSANGVTCGLMLAFGKYGGHRVRGPPHSDSE